MAVTNGYVTLEAFKTATKITDNDRDSVIEASIESASRQVDNYCGRRFWQDQSTRVAYFDVGRSGRWPTKLRLRGAPETADVVIAGIDTVEIETLPDSDNFDELTDYVARPSSATFPNVTHELRRRLGWRPGCAVRITATFGIAEADRPEPVARATLLQAQRTFKRNTDAILGAQLVVAGQAPVTVRASRLPDGDIQQQLDPYRHRWG